ncbi:DEAD/DEAH box helicase family protein [Anoxybacillus geothermalis]|uniref:EcoAI/FtnUII family type I restriction enzme subunit R n=1 Tax=Geobacillus sp. DSP4a TaxID=2508873 RepID=UPI0006A2ECFA|nr:DEAD/DEAH box helicase family protein [Geobacillus sp. DSP4a]AKU27045.1 restriction endonuclease [Geobacillus sp. LC300]KZE96939.1 Type-1 restriction enzyme R protein [Geobacillus stearothermophilus]MED4923800.1 DEAD/DEAH box helicase family protein [Anoxybacillus geothermalis]
MKKSGYTERDICTKFITPALVKAGWDLHKQIREEVTFTAGRIVVKGKMHTRKKAKRADYILYYKPHLPLAIIEAKDDKHSVGDGMQQALEYAKILDIPFVFSSNGKAFLFHDRTGQSHLIEKEIPMDQFPSPQELWKRYKRWKGITEREEKIITQDYFVDPSGKAPRYYQRIAINRTVEAIAKGQNRILLVLATGTGKTLTAFQIIWRLWKSKMKKRILFLADRNILVDQTMANDFKHFGDKMTKIKNRKVDKSYEIYLALYQGVSGSEDWKNIYKEFSPDFFDLIIVDECHRGSAREDSAWREILEYFSPATQIGLTATPKETKDVSNIHYFGEPIYTYSLKQGIEDGFLAPYKVIRYTIDKDVEGWRPSKGMKDKYGQVIEDRIYNVKDFDRNLVLEERTKIVAKKITEYLKKTDRYQKTIVFCNNIEHAERMRQALANENSDLVAKNHKYVMRITGDNEEGKAELDNFIDPASTYPVIAVTSKLMTTGVDAQTCKLIVLDANINSMTEFKQIIGRGTRVNEEYNKFSFTIMDFRGVTNLFADPAFDGDPVQIYESKDGDSLIPPDVEEDDSDNDNDISSVSPIDFVGEGENMNGETEGENGVKTYYVNNVKVQVINERVQYYSEDGKLITESLKDYTRKTIKKEYASLDEFLQKWNSAERKQAIIEELLEQGILLDELQEEVGRDYDPFDLICHVAFDMKPLTRKERAMNVKKRNYFAKYGDKARAVLEALLDKYADQGIENIESMEVLKLPPFDQFGSLVEIVKSFGGKQQYLKAIRELEQQIYTSA